MERFNRELAAQRVKDLYRIELTPIPADGAFLYLQELAKNLRSAPYVTNFLGAQYLHDAERSGRFLDRNSPEVRYNISRKLSQDLWIIPNSKRLGIHGDRVEAIAAESCFFQSMRDILKDNIKLHIWNPISWEQWEAELEARGKEIGREV